MIRPIDGARKIMRVCASVKKKEKTLIITDPGVDPQVPLYLLEASVELGSEALIAVTGHRRSLNDEPPQRVTDMMMKSDIILGVGSLHMFFTRAKRKACRRGARFLSMAGMNVNMLSSGGIEADFKAQRPVAQRLARRLTAAKEISIRTASGTYLTASLEGRKGVANTSLYEKPGDSGGVIDIEAYVAPVEDSVEGVAKIDGCVYGIGLIRAPIKLEINNGVIKKIRGGIEANMLRKMLSSQKDPSVYQIAEIGIGLNPKARLRGVLVEDESVLGTAHLASGDNSGFPGGRNPAPVHVDMVFRKPIIQLDGERISVTA